MAVQIEALVALNKADDAVALSAEAAMMMMKPKASKTASAESKQDWSETDSTLPLLQMQVLIQVQMSPWLTLRLKFCSFSGLAAQWRRRGWSLVA